MLANKKSQKRIVFHMICEFLQGKDFITYGILILQGFFTLQEDQLGNHSYFAWIPYAATILIIQGHLDRF